MPIGRATLRVDPLCCSPTADILLVAASPHKSTASHRLRGRGRDSPLPQLALQSDGHFFGNGRGSSDLVGPLAPLGPLPPGREPLNRRRRLAPTRSSRLLSHGARDGENTNLLPDNKLRKRAKTFVHRAGQNVAALTPFTNTTSNASCTNRPRRNSTRNPTFCRSDELFIFQIADKSPSGASRAAGFMPAVPRTLNPQCGSPNPQSRHVPACRMHLFCGPQP